MAYNRVTWPYRFLFLLVFSAALMIVDHRSRLLAPVRLVVSVINLPVQGLIRLPAVAGEWFSAFYPDDSLYRENRALRQKNLVLEAHLQRLRAENERLIKTLRIAPKSGEEGLYAEIIEIGLDPFTHRLALNRGTEAGVYVGQPVINTDGVLGQVSTLGLHRSLATLITDPGHALPVQVQRNGLHAIIRGLGRTDQVEVPFLPTQADVRVDDVLVTSGRGGGFPAGYKVARVREILADTNKAFMTVDAVPFISVERSRDVLLLWVDRPPPAVDSGEDEGEGDKGDGHH